MSDAAILRTALVILGLPILSYAILFFFGRLLPRKGDWVAVGLLGIAWLLALRIFFHFWALDDPGFRLEGQVTWLDLGTFRIQAGMLVDGMTAVMLMVVTTISFLVHLFSVGYMHGDRRYERYFAFLGFFTFSMLLIVLAGNLFFLYIGWELVGLASYLLIGFFFHKHSAANANKKAFLTNRVGDFGFWIGILTFFTVAGTFNYLELFAHVQAGTLSGGLLTFAGVALFMGCVGKSAQMPLHIWLPDAMEGPTPVSALIHAATMVAAGVYMVARLVPLFTPDALLVVAYVGAVTAFVAATIAVVKTDIKRSLAYSTLSQLGYMVMAIGVGTAIAGMFHLTTHAFFKALLFLGSGSVIHAVHTQEMPLMGGLRRKMPITWITMLIATLAISGVPFFSGFYSKDAILGGALAFAMEHPAHFLPFVLGILAAGFTAFYMFRLVFLTFHGEPRDEERFHHAHESPWTMALPLIVLGVLSFVGAGWQGPQTGWFSRFVADYDLPAISARVGLPAAAAAGPQVATTPGAAGGTGQEGQGGHGAAGPEAAVAGEGDHAAAGEAAGHEGGTAVHEAGAAAGHGEAHGGAHGVEHAAHVRAMIMSIAMAFLGILLAWLTYIARRIRADRVQARLPAVHAVLQNMYYFDQLYHRTVYPGTLGLARLARAFDVYVVDGIVNGSGYLTRAASWLIGKFDDLVVDGLVNGVGAVLQGAGEGFRRLQTGRVQTYLAYVSFSVLVLVLVFRAL